MPPLRLHLVDGTYELYRAHFAPRPDHVAPAGWDAKATVGVVASLLALLHDPEEAVTHIAVAFDNPIRSFRNDLFAPYKSDEGVPPDAILKWMTDAMEVVGARFAAQELFVPEMLISARAMKGAVALLEPLLIAGGIQPDSTAVIGTIKGDLHDIGKNLVAMMWKGGNIRVVDLGTNVSADKFLAAAREHKADLIGISALLTTTMGEEEGRRLSRNTFQIIDLQEIFRESLLCSNVPARRRSARSCSRSARRSYAAYAC